MGLLKNDYEVKSHSPNGTDTEKGGLPTYTTDAPAVAGEVFTTGDTTYAKIQRFATRFGVEPRGIERVPEDERTDTNLRKVGTMVWFDLIFHFIPYSNLREQADEVCDSGYQPTW